MRFNILGSLEVIYNGYCWTPTAAKVRSTLALFVMRPNQVIDTGAFFDELWGDNPPKTALTTLQTYVYQLRKNFDSLAGPGAGEHYIVTGANGYRLRMNEELLDASVFESLVRQGQELLGSGRLEESSAKIRSALSLWRGPALADVVGGRRLEAGVSGLEELRIRALSLRIEADRKLGRTLDLLPELRRLVTIYPLNETFHGELITALHDSGRRSEALDAFRSLQEVLRTELGLEPSLRLRRLRDSLLEDQVPERTGR